MPAKPPRENDPLKVSEVLLAFFRLDAATQKDIRNQVTLVSNPNTPEAERSRAEKAVVEILRSAGEKPANALVVSRSERFGPRHQEVRTQMEQAEAAFAGTLARLMAERQLTQVQLAERVGVGQSAISMLLKRRCRPQRRTLGKLAEALGVSVEELWPGFHAGWRSGLL
jgi:DNA-binding XRE family transcriptional regulator